MTFDLHLYMHTQAPTDIYTHTNNNKISYGSALLRNGSDVDVHVSWWEDELCIQLEDEVGLTCISRALLCSFLAPQSPWYLGDRNNTMYSLPGIPRTGVTVAWCGC